MSELAQLLFAAGIFLNALVAVVGAVQSFRNGRKIEQVHVATNSMKDALVAATAKASLAEGMAAGLKEGRRETEL